MTLTLTVTLAGLNGRAAADGLNPNDAAGLVAKTRALQTFPQAPTLPIPGAPVPEALNEPYAGFSSHESTNISWGRLRGPKDSDFAAAIVQLAQDCAEAGNNSELVGKRVKFGDTATNQAKVFQLCAPNGKGVQYGRAYVLLSGDVTFDPHTGYDGAEIWRKKAEEKAVAALSNLCAIQSQDANARIIGEVRGGIEDNIAHAVGVCRYHLPQQ